jgi:signal transduction histidine kinase
VNSPPITVYGPAIVTETAHAMNQMQKRIQDLLNERTQMLAALSHDLRTPITRMKLRAQLIENKEIYEKTTHDLTEMEAMISDTLHYVKQDFQARELKRFDLYSLLESICDNFYDVGKKAKLSSDLTKLVLHGHPIALKRALNNIIDNAIKYAGQADVTLKHANKAAVIIVTDPGPGLPEDQLNKVFTPFYRGENSRSRQTGGTGLGLAIALDVVKSHGGEIKIVNKNPGLCVTVLIPFR